MQTVLQALLADFANRLALTLPETSTFPLCMHFDDVAVNFDYQSDNPQTLLLHTSLGEVPKTHELELYRALLEANLFWSGTGGATIGVNSATREATLAYQFDFSQMRGDALLATVEQFVVLTELWLRFVDEFVKNDPSVSSSGKFRMTA